MINPKNIFFNEKTYILDKNSSKSHNSINPQKPSSLGPKKKKGSDTYTYILYILPCKVEIYNSLSPQHIKNIKSISVFHGPNQNIKNNHFPSRGGSFFHLPIK